MAEHHFSKEEQAYSTLWSVRQYLSYIAKDSAARDVVDLLLDNNIYIADAEHSCFTLWEQGDRWRNIAQLTRRY